MNPERYTELAMQLIQQTQAKTQAMGNPAMTPAHLLVVALEGDAIGTRIVQLAGGNLATAKAALETGLQKVAKVSSSTGATSAGQYASSEFGRGLERSEAIAKELGDSFVGADALFLGAAVAACVVTFFTFLPSFLFILIGGPLVEATHGQMKFTAPLTAITAAVVGVIVNLAMFFAWKIWWPTATRDAPFSGTFDWFSMLLTVAAALALMRYKANVIVVIVTCGALGVATTLITA